MNAITVKSRLFSREIAPIKNRGASLIVVLILLVIVTGLGLGAIQISMMGEKGARNDRDRQIVRQAAEAALMDAEFDIRGPGTATRASLFAPGNVLDFHLTAAPAAPAKAFACPIKQASPFGLRLTSWRPPRLLLLNLGHSPAVLSMQLMAWV